MDEAAAADLSNVWRSRSPPATMDTPSTSSVLPMIEPVTPHDDVVALLQRDQRDDQSAALPNVALSRPPMPAPSREASCSGRFAHEPGERHDRERAAHEDRERAGVGSARRSA